MKDYWTISDLMKQFREEKRKGSFLNTWTTAFKGTSKIWLSATETILNEMSQYAQVNNCRHNGRSTLLQCWSSVCFSFLITINCMSRWKLSLGFWQYVLQNSVPVLAILMQISWKLIELFYAYQLLPSLCLVSLMTNCFHHHLPVHYHFT